MKILWINCDKTSLDETILKIKNTSSPLKVFTPNPEIVLKAIEDKEYKELLDSADISLPDWIGLYLWAQVLDNKYSRVINILLLPYFFFNVLFRKEFLYKKYWQRITWSWLTLAIIEEYNKKWGSLAIVDLYTETDIKKIESQKIMPDILKRKFPNIDFTIVKYKDNNLDEIISKINNNKCEVIFSTLWMKKQEESISKILPHTHNVKAGLWIWGSIDQIIWFQKKAPHFIKKAWFEWLYRIITSPNKKRNLQKSYNALIKFTIEILKNK